MKPGDRVVCISTNTHMHRGVLYKGSVKGKIYTITDAFGCSCGARMLNIGIFVPNGAYQTCLCNKRYRNQGCWLHDAKRFVPLTWNDCRAELIEEIMDVKEEVEPVKETV